jgi:hypothetical protein
LLATKSGDFMRRFVLACSALICFGMSGCRAGQPEPIEPKAGATHAPSPVPTSSLTPPALPKLAKRADATGAANFVLYWVKVSNYAALTGDTDLLRTISTPDCEGCNRYIRLYEKTYADGGYFRGGDRSLDDVSTTSDGAITYISASLVATRGRFKMNSKAAEEASPHESTPVTFVARRTDVDWTMTDIGLNDR